MNTFVANPEWGVWIIAYFFLGGIAAGSYFVGILIEWFGPPEDRDLARIAYRIAFPLVLCCSIFLIVDLNRPDRFWHMMFKSEVTKEAFAEGFPFTGGWGLAVHALAFKYWSPMSAGSWGLAVFGACSFASFLAAVWPERWIGKLLLRNWPHLVLQIIGCGCGFFVASYTGALLSATNQPIWSDSTWLAPLFLASAASTSVATVSLIAWWRNTGTAAGRDRLNGVEPLVIGLELVLLACFVISLGDYIGPLLTTIHGELLVVGTLAVGILSPMFLHVLIGKKQPWGVPVSAACVLVGGLILRYGILTTPPELLASAPSVQGSSADNDAQAVGSPDRWGLGPEIDRQPGEPGADINNRRIADVVPRSKLPRDPSVQP